MSGPRSALVPDAVYICPECGSISEVFFYPLEYRYRHKPDCLRGRETPD